MSPLEEIIDHYETEEPEWSEQEIVDWLDGLPDVDYDKVMTSVRILRAKGGNTQQLQRFLCKIRTMYEAHEAAVESRKPKWYEIFAESHFGWWLGGITGAIQPRGDSNEQGNWGSLGSRLGK